METQVHPLRFRHPLLLGTVQSRYRIPARRRRLHRSPEPVQQISSDGLNSQHALLVRESDLAEMMNLGGDERIYPASMTKIMTALLTIENLPDLNETNYGSGGHLRGTDGTGCVGSGI